MNERAKGILPPFLVLTVIFAILYGLNSMMPLHRDDYDYSMIWGTGQLMASFSDIFTSLFHHYMEHGGRVVSVFWLDLFLLLGTGWFDVFNAAMFASLVLLIFLHGRRSLSLDGKAVLLAGTGLLTWLGLPHFGETAIWMSGSTVYLWTAVPAFLFFLPYNLYLAGRWEHNGWYMVPVMLVFGIMAGCSVENLGVTSCVLSAGILYLCHRNRKLRPWMVSGALGTIAGFLVLLAAPGNYVRYDDQSSPFLQHIGNQFAGNGEMILYILPVILLLNLSYRILQANLLKQRGIRLVPARMEGYRTKILLLLLIVLLVISYFNGSFVANAIRDACVFAVLSPIGLTDEKTISHFDNVMAGFEEMAIYWLAVFLIFFSVRQALGFHKENRMLLKESISFSDLYFFSPSVRYACFLFFLAFFNNFVMIAAPTFPARATFSSVCMILMGFVAIFSLDEISSACSGQVSKHVLLAGALCLGVYTVSASAVILHSVQKADAIRIEIIQKSARMSIREIEIPPLEFTNRALRHVYYEDFDNGVTKDGLIERYGLDNIIVDEDADLDIPTAETQRLYERKEALKDKEELDDHEDYDAEYPRDS